VSNGSASRDLQEGDYITNALGYGGYPTNVIFADPLLNPKKLLFNYPEHFAQFTSNPELFTLLWVSDSERRREFRYLVKLNANSNLPQIEPADLTNEYQSILKRETQ